MIYEKAALILLNIQGHPQVAAFEIKFNQSLGLPQSTNQVQWWTYKKQSFFLETEQEIDCKLNELYIINQLIFDSELESETALWERVKRAYENALLYSQKTKKYEIINLLEEHSHHLRAA